MEGFLPLEGRAAAAARFQVLLDGFLLVETQLSIKQ
jgi:hypothetical protein